LSRQLFIISIRVRGILFMLYEYYSNSTGHLALSVNTFRISEFH